MIRFLVIDKSSDLIFLIVGVGPPTDKLILNHLTNDLLSPHNLSLQGIMTGERNHVLQL